MNPKKTSISTEYSDIIEDELIDPVIEVTFFLLSHVIFEVVHTNLDFDFHLCPIGNNDIIQKNQWCLMNFKAFFK
jgi:hypothetical protein